MTPSGTTLFDGSTFNDTSRDDTEGAYEDGNTTNQNSTDQETPARNSTPSITTVPPTTAHTPMITTRSGRTVKPPSRFQDFIAYEAFVCDGIVAETLAVDDHPYSFNVITAYAASSDPDIMYWHEAMAAPDAEEFRKAMMKEVTAHTKNNNWLIVKRSQIPRNQMVLPAVWAMRRKRHISTGEIYKWKARLNIHGGKQIHGFNYWETYAISRSMVHNPLDHEYGSPQRMVHKAVGFCISISTSTRRD
jgi:hypothetical protein